MSSVAGVEEGDEMAVDVTEEVEMAEELPVIAAIKGVV